MDGKIHIGSKSYTREEIEAAGGFAAVMHERAAAAFRQVGDEENARRADGYARKHRKAAK